MLGLLCLADGGKVEVKQLGLRLPQGFSVTEFADHRLANDIYTLSIDPKGRVIVAGRGYIRILVDRDGDGRADHAKEFADRPKDGAMGLLWEGTTLWATGDGGLLRFRDEDGDDRADGPPELIRKMKTGGEHAAHAIRRGPDGLLYVLCGNSTGIDKSFAQLPTSPIADPVAGCVLCFSPDYKQTEIVAHGFRNPYDLDFNPDGELFTFDADNERCVSLPWYESTRLYHVIPGGHYGWLNPQRADTFRLPPYFIDVIAPVAYLGRGSPTGVVCYRHLQFPERYRGGLFLADWTFGKIHFVPLTPSGSTYTGVPEVFLSAEGDNGFAPTDLEVHPSTGDLYISVGGRGTRGAIYRVRYTQNAAFWNCAELASIRSYRHKPRRRPIIWDDEPVDWQAASRKKIADDPHYAADLLQFLVFWIDQWPRSPILRLRLVRVIQLAGGDLGDVNLRGTVWEGYSRCQPEPGLDDAVRALGKVFPTRHADVDREMARLFAMAEADLPGLLNKVAAHITPGSDPVEDIHYLIVFARLRGPRTAKHTQRIADALLTLDQKIEKRKLFRDTNWPLRVGEMYAELARKDPNLHAALLAHPSFGRPDHLLFTKCPGFPRGQAAEIYWTRVNDTAEYPWSAALVDLLAELPAERVLPLLRDQWENRAIRGAIASVLARRPDPADRQLFLETLDEPSIDLLNVSLSALERLPVHNDPVEYAHLIKAMQRIPDETTRQPLRERLVRHLARVTGQDGLGADAALWSAWLQTHYPDAAQALAPTAAVDMAAWKARLHRIHWPSGDPVRGKSVFVKASCLACHSGTSAVGPDLRGVTKRFARDELFADILEPSRVVPERYQSTLIATRSGAIHQGIVIYDAVDGLILQTGADATIRVAGRDIAETRRTNTSLMPTGLLDSLADADLSDLYAYLKALDP